MKIAEIFDTKNLISQYIKFEETNNQVPYSFGMAEEYIKLLIYKTILHELDDIEKITKKISIFFDKLEKYLTDFEIIEFLYLKYLLSYFQGNPKPYLLDEYAQKLNQYINNNIKISRSNIAEYEYLLIILLEANNRKIADEIYYNLMKFRSKRIEEIFNAYNVNNFNYLYHLIKKYIDTEPIVELMHFLAIFYCKTINERDPTIFLYRFLDDFLGAS